MPYTSQGYMTAGDVEEWRRDTDWYELHPPVVEEDQCPHGTWMYDDCDPCDRWPDDGQHLAHGPLLFKSADLFGNIGACEYAERAAALWVEVYG